MQSDDVGPQVDAAAALLGLPIATAHRPGVLAYFALAATLAELVMAVPLEASDEAANTFRPIAPGDLEPGPAVGAET